MREHRYADMEYVRDNPNEYWSKYYLSCNKQLTVKDIKTLKLPKSTNDGGWDWCFISQYINIQEVRNNPYICWDKDWLSMNKQLTAKDVETLILPNSIGDWNWYYISKCINIQEVINNPNKPWNISALKLNKGCTSKILEFLSAGLLHYLQKNIYTFKYHTDISVKYEY